MKSTLSVEIDTGRVQSAVQSVIRPMVEEALSQYDVRAAIAAALSRKEEPSDLYHRIFTGSHPSSVKTTLDSMVHDSITAIAKEYVERNVRYQKEHVEEALRKMMQGSSSRLTKAFLGAIEKGFDDGWGFEMKVSVEPKAEEKEDD